MSKIVELIPKQQPGKDHPQVKQTLLLQVLLELKEIDHQLNSHHNAIQNAHKGTHR